MCIRARTMHTSTRVVGLVCILYLVCILCIGVPDYELVIGVHAIHTTREGMHSYDRMNSKKVSILLCKL